MASPPSSVTTSTGKWIWANPFGNVSSADSISVSNEIDQYRFMADQTGSYTITVTSASLDSQLRVYNSSGTDLSGIMDLHGGGGTETYTLSNYPTGTWFYVDVTGYLTGTGSYTLSVNGPAPAPQPSVSTPSPTFAGSVSGNIDYGGDLDYVAVTAPSGTSTLNLTVTPSSGLDTYVELYNSSGTLLRAIGNTSSGSPGVADSASNISVTAGATYYVGISSWSTTSTGSYTVNADFNPDAAQPAEITVLGNGVSITDNDTTPSTSDFTDFGSATQGGAAVQHTFTVRNDGGSTLTTSGLTLPSGFSLVEGLSSSIAPGGFDTFTVQLDTTGTGTKSGQISFSNNDSNENPYNFSIAGTVNAASSSAEITVLGNGVSITDNDTTPSTFDFTDFGTATQGGAAVQHIFTVRNDGGSTLTTSGLTLPSGFSLVEGLSSSIAPGGSDTFTVQLDTTSTGTKSGQISFSNNDSNENPFDFSITGTVNAGSHGSQDYPIVSLQPDSGLGLGDGAESWDVLALQNWLISQGYLSQGYNTGYYGSLTKAAVVELQTALISEGYLSQGNDTGLYGRLTESALEQSYGASALTNTYSSTSLLAGFDVADYPGAAAMSALHSQTNLNWAGYYLDAPSQNTNTGWMGTRAYLQDTLGWNLAPIYVGAQDSGSNDTIVSTTNPISQADTDAGQALAEMGMSSIALANMGLSPNGEAGLNWLYKPGDQNFSQNFHAGTVVFLDWENTSPDQNSVNYIVEWCKKIALSGYYEPGVYCPSSDIATLANALGNLTDGNGSPVQVQLWGADWGPYKGDSQTQSLQEVVIDSSTSTLFSPGDLTISGTQIAALQYGRGYGVHNSDLSQPDLLTNIDLDLANSSLFTSATSAEVSVLGNGVSITDNDTTPSTSDFTDFGSATQGGAAVQHIFTVRNDGGSTLTTSGLTLPSGFSLVEGLSSSIAPGGSDTFTVQLDTTSTGTKSGQISFSDNDSNENPFNFSITGTVNAATQNRPDLTASNLNVVEATATPGQSITISFDLSNIGTADAAGFDVGFYVSSDSTIDLGDELFAYQTIALQAANSTTHHNGTAPLPLDLTSGHTYYIGVIADYTNVITNEISENNASNADAISIEQANSAPVLNAVGGSLSYTENQAATAINTVLTVSDADSANLTGATISITGNYQSGQDALGFASQNGITGSFNASTGVMTLSGSASVTNYQTALRAVTYFDNSDTPSAATRTVSYQVDDGQPANHASNVVTATVAVTPVNDAPSGTNKTVTTLEDTAYTLATSDFGFSDVDGNALTAVKITTLPGAGTLKDNGTAVTVGQFVSVADISGNKLVFTPAANANGNSYASFTFQVQDNGGTANGGIDTDQSPNTLTFNVTPVNDAPSGADKTVTMLKGTAAYTFAGSEFGFSDVDGNGLAAVKITTLPGTGTLKDNGVAVTAGQFVSLADIGGNKLVFTPAANANGNNYASLTFQVQDNGGTANGGVDIDQSPNTLTFNVSSVSTLTAGGQIYRLGDYTLYNNNWAAGNLVIGRDYTQQIVFDPSNINNNVVMSWSYPEIQGADFVYAYPEIIWGSQYGVLGPGTTAYTKHISDINSLAVNYSTSISGETSKFDVAIEIWTVGAIAGAITSEIMVKVHGWTPNGFSDGPGTTYSDSQVGISGSGTAVEAIHYNSGGAPTHTFITIDTTSDMLSGQLDFAPILKNLVAQGIINQNDYVAGVELGSEMIMGSGSLTVNSFSVVENVRGPNQVPVIHVTGSISVQPNGWLQASLAAFAPVFNVTDGDNDPVVTYRFIDVGTGATTAHLWTTAGGYLAQGATAEVAAAQLSSAWLQGGSVNGSDTLRVQVFDGFDWSAPADITVLTRGPNHVPVVSAAATSGGLSTNVALSSLFSVTDGDSDPIVQYRVTDVTTGANSAHLLLNAAQQAESTQFTIDAANLSAWQIATSSVSRSVNAFTLQAYDGFDWSAPTTINFTSLGPNQVPVVHVTGSISVQPNGWLQASLAAFAPVFNVTDGDNDPVVTYRFIDVGTGATTAHLWTTAGGYLAQGATAEVAAAQLSSAWLQGGSVNGSDTLRVQVFDGFDWSAPADITVLTRGPNHVPVVSAAATSGGLSTNVALSSLFSVTDGDSDPIVQYRVTDVTTGANSAHLLLNAAQQAESTQFTIDAANLSAWQIATSSVSRSVNAFTLQAYDGFDWSAPTTINFTSLGPNQVPVVHVTGSISVQPNGWLQASLAAFAPVFNVTDGDNDPVVTYRFIDVGTGATTAHLWTTAGGYLAQGATAEVAAAQLSSAWLQGGSVNGSDTLRVQVFDGFDWSAPADITVLTRGPNHAPVVTAATTSGGLSTNVALSSLFSVTDGDSDPIVQYRVTDVTTGANSAHLLLNAAQQAESTQFTIDAANLSAWQIATSSVSRSVNAFTLQAYDGFDWSAPTTINFTSLGPNQVPVVHVTGSISVQPNGWLQASLAAFAPVFNVTDGDNDPVVTYRFIDVGTGATTAHLWTTAGGYLAQGATAEVAAAQLSSAWLQGGSVNGSDTLRVQVFDGFDWSAPADITVLTRGPNHAPVVTAATTSGGLSTNVALSSLFSVTDGDSDPIVQYRVTDVTTGANSAHLLLNAAQQAESTQFTIDAANLSAWQIATSSVSRSVNAFTLQAYDGFDWSAPTTINFTSLGPNQVPVVHVTGSISVQPNGWLQASLAAFAPVFNVTDGDNDPVVTYRFIDVGTGATTAHLWTTAGGYLAQGATAEVAAAQLSSAWLQGGSVNGSDTLRVQVFDGFDWSAPADITVLTRGPNHVPVVSAAATSGGLSTNVALSSLFSVTDGDSDPIVQYRVTDVTTGANSAHLLLNAAQQAESTQFTIDAANLSAWQIATSSVSRSVNAFTLQAYDGFDWSAPTTINFTSLGPNQVPVVHVTGSISVQPNGWLQASLAAFAPVFNVTDGDNDPVVTYRFIDVGTGATTAHLWTTAGGYLAQGATAEVAAAQLSSAWLQGGSVNGSDTLRVQVFDGFDWSAPADITVLTRGPNHVPVVSAAATSLGSSQTVAVSSIFSVTDGDGDPITQYKIMDATVGGAHLLLNGIQQAENTVFTIDAADLSKWQIATSSISHDMNQFQISASDGFDFSNPTTISVISGNNSPVEMVTSGLQLTPNQWLDFNTSNLPISVTDADGDPLVTYRFTDVGTGAATSHLWFSGYSGGYLPQGGTVDVPAAQLSSFWIQGDSSGGIDTLRVQVSDGFIWSAPHEISVMTSSTPVNTNVGAHIVAGTTTGANDILIGTAASDTFVFAPNFGNDTINNYTPGQDVVAIDHTVFATAAAALAAAVDTSGNAVIHVDANDSITITATSVATLIQHQSDFHIV